MKLLVILFINKSKTQIIDNQSLIRTTGGELKVKTFIVDIKRLTLLVINLKTITILKISMRNYYNYFL